MAIIGNFTRKNTGFTGHHPTLTFTASVTIEPADKRGDRTPDYRVFCQSSGPGEIGAAWKRKGRFHTSPSASTIRASRPIDAASQAGFEHGYSLIWERDRPRY